MNMEAGKKSIRTPRLVVSHGGSMCDVGEGSMPLCNLSRRCDAYFAQIDSPSCLILGSKIEFIGCISG